MLFDRLREIDDDGIIYHYCSGETFKNIIVNKTIRFSDIHMLNDAEEGRWGYGVFEKAATRILNRVNISEIMPDIPKSFFDRVDEHWAMAGLGLSSFVSCFSSDGDSLSQWRAYADDGQGFAIGFYAKELRRLPIQILDVLYGEEDQLKEMIVALGGMFMQMVEENKQDDDEWFFNSCMLLASSSVAFKNPAWRDEKEVRCHHVVNVDVSGPIWIISDAGGESEGKPIDGIPIDFQTRNGSIVPYFDMDFEVSDEHKPISDIVLGPKCPNAYGNVKFLLGNNGYGEIELKTAGGAYQ